MDADSDLKYVASHRSFFDECRLLEVLFKYLRSMTKMQEPKDAYALDHAGRGDIPNEFFFLKWPLNRWADRTKKFAYFMWQKNGIDRIRHRKKIGKKRPGNVRSQSCDVISDAAYD